MSKYVEITKRHENATTDKLNVNPLLICEELDSSKSSAHSLPRQLWAIWKSGFEEVKGSVHPTPQGNTSWWTWGDCPRFPQVMSVGVGVKWLVHKGNWALGKIDCRFLQLLRPPTWYAFVVSLRGSWNFGFFFFFFVLFFFVLFFLGFFWGGGG